MSDERAAIEAGLRALRAGLDSIEPSIEAEAAVELAARGAEPARGTRRARAHTGGGWFRRASGVLGALLPPRRLRWALPSFAGVALAAIGVSYVATRPPEPLPTIVRIGEGPPRGTTTARRVVEVPARGLERTDAALSLPSGAPVYARRDGAGQALASRDGARPDEDDGGFAITAPDSGRVAVFQTSNPRIRVVWFYGDASED
ncbi:MAG: hypothetical protein R3195_04840 [Gemmatimonadota bacterium]|nr:hypothetical protein [Gemmatimonadota bacterium]